MTQRRPSLRLRTLAPCLCLIAGGAASARAGAQPAAGPDVIHVSYMLLVTAPGPSPLRIPAAGSVMPMPGDIVTPPAVSAKLTADYGVGEAELAASAVFDLDPTGEQVLPGRLDGFSCALSVADRKGGSVGLKLRMIKPGMTLPDAVFVIENRSGRVVVSARYGEEGVFALLSVTVGPPVRRLLPPVGLPSGTGSAPPAWGQGRAPWIAARVPITLPAGLSRRTEDTIVILNVAVSAQGIPTAVDPVAGERKFAQAVADSIMRWRFTVPAGEPARVMVGFNLRGAVPVDAPVRPFAGGGPPPVKVLDVRPTYPSEARRKRSQGMVVTTCTVDPAGVVADAIVTQGIDGLNEAALDAVLRWRFTPRADGAVITMATTVNFALR